MSSRILAFLHLLFHRWLTVRDCGKTVYQRCRQCGRRRAWQRWPGVGAQPIDYRWVVTGDWSPRPRPPQGGTGAVRPA